jgi:hypothetical protein
VNRYGAEALEHWRAYLSGSYSGLRDPVRFFTKLGEQADAEIEDRHLEYAGPDIPGESAEDKRARFTQAMNRVLPSSLFEHPAAGLSGDDSAGLRGHHREPGQIACLLARLLLRAYPPFGLAAESYASTARSVQIRLIRRAPSITFRKPRPFPQTARVTPSA